MSQNKKEMLAVYVSGSVCPSPDVCPRKIPKLDQARAAPWRLRGPLWLHCGWVTLFHSLIVNDVPHKHPSAVRWEGERRVCP